MKKYAPYLLVFILGITAGAVAVNYVIKSKKNNQKNKSMLDNNSKKKDKITAVFDTTREKPQLKKVKIKTADTISDYYPHIDNNNPVLDSLITENIYPLKNENTSWIEKDNIKREELLMVKQMEVERKTKTKADKDTLLNKISGIKNEQVVTVMELEVWKNPLNTKGYRMGKNKIAIYGIEPLEVKRLIEIEKNYYLQIKNDYYLLERSSEFKNLKPLREKEVISQLNEL